MFSSTRRLLALAVSLCALVLLTACGTPTQAPAPTSAPRPTSAPPAATQPPSQPTAAPATAAPTAAAATPHQGGSVTIGLSAGWDVLDPAATAFTFARQIMQFMYDPLLREDPATGKILPGLAESYEVSSDNKTITLRLRRNVKFHDGTPFNAQAVKFSLDRIQDPALKSPWAATITGPVDKIEAKDDTTIVITLKQPFAPFLDSLAQINLAPVSPTAVQKWGKDYILHPTGTGPFMYKSETPNDNLVLVRNPDYNWGPSYASHQGPAYLEQITFRNIPEDATRMALGQSEGIDLVYNPVARQVKDYTNNPNFQVLFATRPGVPRTFIMTTSKWPFDDVKTRQAIPYAIDRKKFLTDVYENIGDVADGIITPNLLGFSKTVSDSAPKYDLNKAKALLSDAGWKPGSDGILTKDGKAFNITIGSQPAGSFAATSQILQANLKAVGIQANIESVEQAAILQGIRDGRWNMADFLFVATDPDVMYTVLHSSSIDKAWNTARYNSSKMDQLLTDARSTLDPVKRAQLYEEAQKLVIQDAPYVPYYLIKNVYIVNARVQNVKTDIQAFFDFYDAWVTK